MLMPSIGVGTEWLRGFRSHRDPHGWSKLCGSRIRALLSASFHEMVAAANDRLAIGPD